MTVDILTQPITGDEHAVLDVYTALKELVQRDLPPFAHANLLDALASVSIVVTGSLTEYEQLIDLGI